MLPRQLESFKYDAGGATVGFANYAPRLFYPGLLAHANTLVELFITDADNTSEFNEYRSVIGSFTAFTVLTHLRVNVELLLGQPTGHPSKDITRSPLDALLPPSLITLELELGREHSLNGFVAITGIPHSLIRTSRQLPALRQYHIGVKGIYPHSRRPTELRQAVGGETE